MSKKKLPRRPKELAETDDKANQMWDLLLKCWDHNPAARPDALFILSYVCLILPIRCSGNSMGVTFASFEFLCSDLSCVCGMGGR